jgi:hypothetical protein
MMLVNGCIDYQFLRVEGPGKQERVVYHAG